MRRDSVKRLLFFAVALCTPVVILSSCLPSKPEMDVRGGYADELWAMAISKEPPEAGVGSAEAKGPSTAFRDKSLGKALTKPPEVSGG